MTERIGKESRFPTPWSGAGGISAALQLRSNRAAKGLCVLSELDVAVDPSTALRTRGGTHKIVTGRALWAGAGKNACPTEQKEKRLTVEAPFDSA
jgi:hypothetical protein